jgi:hypothetical protein
MLIKKNPTRAFLLAIALLPSSGAYAQVDIATALNSAVSAIGGALYQGVAAAQAVAPTQNMLPACPPSDSPAALKAYLDGTPGLESAIVSGDTARAQSLLSAAIAACPNGIATITPGIAN